MALGEGGGELPQLQLLLPNFSIASCYVIDIELHFSDNLTTEVPAAAATAAAALIFSLPLSLFCVLVIAI